MIRRVVAALVVAALAALPLLAVRLKLDDEYGELSRMIDWGRADTLASSELSVWNARAREGGVVLGLLCASGPTGDLAVEAGRLGAAALVVETRSELGWATPHGRIQLPEEAFVASDSLGVITLDGGRHALAIACATPDRRAAIAWELPAGSSSREGVALDEDLRSEGADRLVIREVATFPNRATGSPTSRLVVWTTHETTSSPFAWVDWLALGLAVLGAVAGWTLVGRGSRDPRLEAAVARVGKGDLDVTLDGRSATASAFNRMTRELRETQTRLARAERIAAWRDIARRIAHEIKNPLTPIKMAMETLRKTHARKHPDFDEIFEESTKTVLEETSRLEKIVTEFSRFARMPRPKAESLDVAEVAERVVSMHDLPAAHATLPEAAKGVRVELSMDETLPSVRADREQLTQVLVNLVQNACDAAREKQGDAGGRVIVRLERGENDGVRIVVSDNGPGIPHDARMAVLEPYYTTKSHGTGLGLAIVDRIVSDHGGTLTLGDAAELRGASVTIALRREGPSDEPESSVGV